MTEIPKHCWSSIVDAWCLVGSCWDMLFACRRNEERAPFLPCSALFLRMRGFAQTNKNQVVLCLGWSSQVRHFFCLVATIPSASVALLCGDPSQCNCGELSPTTTPLGTCERLHSPQLPRICQRTRWTMVAKAIRRDGRIHTNAKRRGCLKRRRNDTRKNNGDILVIKFDGTTDKLRLVAGPLCERRRAGSRSENCGIKFRSRCCCFVLLTTKMPSWLRVFDVP